ncbi:MAG: hypothetical protein HXS41_09835 [Theionarchaea archaeon]|nr:hypothetical protein [Theionarchaea archaeon]MBU6999388.1 hypothetical protein [Theionarchaea archaeon]MBU7021345.1 hypothetical protein [Theionarchaea archaeon]MBU7035923.1 hypothetical protein [Theionarchaea archaeon]MBU7041573.1 hypothetical protein [Theionarchaea archaeon]
MKEQMIKATAMATVLFAIVFAALLIFVGIEGVETPTEIAVAVILGSIVFFVVSYSIKKK